VIDRQMWDKIVEKAYFPHIWCSENVAGANGKLKCQTDFEPCLYFAL
jgi:hypothetical protein